MNIKNSTGRIARGIDVKADGGYVVAAASLHVNGNRYKVEKDVSQLQTLPQWVLDLIQGEPTRSCAQSVQHEGEAIQEGARNNRLFAIACSLRGQHAMELEQLKAKLLEFNENKCVPPLPESEVLIIANSAAQFPAERKPGKPQQDSPLWWMRFDVKRFLSDTRINLMTERQLAWWLRLRCFAWQAGGYLPADTDKLAKLARASAKPFQKDSDVVLAEYERVTVDAVDMLRHPEMAELFTEAMAKSEANKRNGQTGGNASKGKASAGTRRHNQSEQSTHLLQ